VGHGHRGKWDACCASCTRIVERPHRENFSLLYVWDDKDDVFASSDGEEDLSDGVLSIQRALNATL